MDVQILAHLQVGERTFTKHLELPIDPVLGMKLALTCEDIEHKVYAEIDVQITDLIFIEKENRLICIMKHFHENNEYVMTILFEADNWVIT